MTLRPEVTPDTGEQREAPRLALTPDEAAHAIGVGRTTIYELLRSGQLRSVKVGTRYVVPIASIDAFLAESDSDPAA